MKVPEMDFNIFRNSMFDKVEISTQWEKDHIFTKWLAHLVNLSRGKKKMKLYHIPHKNVNSKWIKKLNVKKKAIKTSCKI